MRRFFVFFLSSSALLLLQTVATATPEQVSEDFEALKTVAVDYEKFGNICEQVAKLRLAEQYQAPQYKIVIGIGYDGFGRTLGELDVVVMRAKDREAILISEVKCWNNLHKANIKAQNQLDRFEGHIERGSKLFMYYADDRATQAFHATQFDEQPEYIKISQDGGLEHGFDQTLGLSMNEVKDLREQLMRCQKSGKCPEARY